MSSIDYNQRNIDTYNSHAKEFEEYFASMSPRTAEIELGLQLAKATSKASVVELDCGDGRDAAQIVKRVAVYSGCDPSAKLLDLAKAKVPTGNFTLADAQSFAYPGDLDVVYAFASLLHINKQDMSLVFQKVAQCLKTGGTFVISLKERAKYTQEAKEDRFGQRMFYYYNSSEIKKIAGTGFESVHESHQTFGKTDWLTIILRKIS